MAINQLNTTELDFDQIKANIKNHFQRQDSIYKDWNFDGSSLNMILDVLAYNTHYNAVLAHMAINESFIDSAQIRKNVVSHAKLVGYTPRSAKCAEAMIDVAIAIADYAAAPDSKTLFKGTKFTTVLDETIYTFITGADYTTNKSQVNNSYNFTKITIYEGTLQVSSYSVNNSLANQKFIIDEINVDTSTLIVRVREYSNINRYRVYTVFGSGVYKTLEDLDSESLVYFISENIYGRYEILFGNGIYGALPGNLNIVELEYITTVGDTANYANHFTLAGGNDVGTVTIISNASGGGGREGIDSIRFNAPISIITQNRAVTADDYRSLILREFANIQTINVWGGESASPPEYGKVFITIKPKAAEQLTALEKDHVLTLLNGKKILTVTPVIVNIDFTYIYLDVYFKFNSNLTVYGQSELESIVRTTIKNFNTTELQEFDNVFRYSKLLKTIDNSNPGILNSFAQVYLYKKLSIYAYIPTVAILDFNTTPYINDTSTLAKPLISTDGFIFNGQNVSISDETGQESVTIRNVYMHAGDVRLGVSCGNFDISTGVLNLNLISNNDDIDIKIYLEPSSYDLAPTRQQLLVIDSETSTVIGSIDTIVVSGSAGAANYSTYIRK